MKKRKSIMIAFFAGVIVGIVIVFALGAIAYYLDPGTSLTADPKTFGDIKVWTQKPIPAEGVEAPVDIAQELHRQLWMTKDDVPFLMISQGKAGQITCLFLLRGPEEAVLSLDPSDTPGKWCNAVYSRSTEAGHPIGDVYVDINFDGSFDLKVIVDQKGNRVSRSMFIDGTWIQIDSYRREENRVVLGRRTYLFDPNSGLWQEER